MSEEKSNKVLGKKIIVREMECAPNGLTKIKFPPAIILSYENEEYKIMLERKVRLNRRLVQYATISARHVGYPVSSLKKTGLLAVAGRFDSGEDFIACINLK
jgi:hypothetical protein